MQPVIREFLIDLEISELETCVLTLNCADLENFSKGKVRGMFKFALGGGGPRHIFVSFLHVCKLKKFEFFGGSGPPIPSRSGHGIYQIAAFRHNIKSKDNDM